MTRPLISLLLAVPVAFAISCKKPDLDYGKLQIGITKKEVADRAGQPTRTSVQGAVEIWEYEAYDRYGAMAVNRRSHFVRFVDGRVDFFGTREALEATKPSAARATPGAKAGAAAPQPAAFDLRAELEKLEAMKKDGLISETEYKELRQRVLEKAKAQ
ncbi:MAG: hypothetical protein H6P99_2384 [Holophagaceae bacterium]|nr:hypothetical protein [Holophagaceae bacterium]